MAEVESINGNPIVAEVASESIQPSVDAWLAAHPEATTTVQDNSITNAKLVQTGGILSELAEIKQVNLGFERSLFVNGYSAANTSATNNSIAPFVYPSNRYSFEGKTVAALHLNVLRAGTLSVGYGPFAAGAAFNQSDATVTNTLTLGTGEQTVELPYKFTVPSGNALFVGFTGDTAGYAYGSNGTDKRFLYLITSTGIFNESSNSLGVDVYTEGFTDTIPSLASELGELSDAVLAGKIEAVYDSMSAITYNDDFTASWATANTYSNTPVSLDEDVMLQCDGELNVRVLMRNGEPGTGTLTRVDWSTAERNVRIPAGMWFVANFRNLAADTTITLDYVREHAKMVGYGEYTRGYMDAAIASFENAVMQELANYPIRFGVITDAHYPTDNIASLPANATEYYHRVQRGEIENGCAALREIADSLNLAFIVDCGDDAGYSTADSNVPNIIYAMTRMQAILRGNIPAICINGNHDAWQNNSRVNGADIHAARLVNLPAATPVAEASTNYYLDDTYQMIRYIFFDTEERADYTHAQASAYLSQMLSTAPSDYKYILISHRDVMGNSEFSGAADYVSEVTPYIPRILFNVTGHLHTDASYTKSDLLDISFIAACQVNYAALTSAQREECICTDKESSFAVVGYDPINRKAKVFGYGMAETREFEIGK